jgi:hypothetical protein
VWAAASMRAESVAVRPPVQMLASPAEQGRRPAEQGRRLAEQEQRPQAARVFAGRVVLCRLGPL